MFVTQTFYDAKNTKVNGRFYGFQKIYPSQQHPTDVMKLPSILFKHPKNRKPLLFLPVFCQLLQCISYGLNYWFMKEMDWRFLYLELIGDLGGSNIVYYMMEYSYIVDITTAVDRLLIFTYRGCIFSRPYIRYQSLTTLR